MVDQVNDRGWLDVDSGHRLYWEDWGDPMGVPVIFLHGGPGAGFDDTHKQLFDARRHHVLFHDQRGCGRSAAGASTEHNTTTDLINDIESLRRHIGWASAHVVGGSWGSTLGLLYALAHHSRVRSLTLWSIYLARRFDNEWFFNGPPHFFFPTEWERFIGVVPARYRASPCTIIDYYNQRLNDSDQSIARQYAVEWTLWETALTSLAYDPARNERDITADPATLSGARLEAHYFAHGCFMPENHIITEIGHLQDLGPDPIRRTGSMC